MLTFILYFFNASESQLCVAFPRKSSPGIISTGASL